MIKRTKKRTKIRTKIRSKGTSFFFSLFFLQKFFLVFFIFFRTIYIFLRTTCPFFLLTKTKPLGRTFFRSAQKGTKNKKTKRTCLLFDCWPFFPIFPHFFSSFFLPSTTDFRPEKKTLNFFFWFSAQKSLGFQTSASINTKFLL